MATCCSVGARVMPRPRRGPQPQAQPRALQPLAEAPRQCHPTAGRLGGRAGGGERRTRARRAATGRRPGSEPGEPGVPHPGEPASPPASPGLAIVSLRGPRSAHHQVDPQCCAAGRTDDLRFVRRGVAAAAPVELRPSPRTARRARPAAAKRKEIPTGQYCAARCTRHNSKPLCTLSPSPITPPSATNVQR